MSATYLGGKTVGGCIPSVTAGLDSAQAGITASLGAATARLDGTIAAKANVGISPPSFSATAEAGIALTASANAGISGPAVQVDVAAIGAAEAEIAAEVGALNAAASLLAQLLVTLGSAGIHLYLLEGAIGEMDSDLGSELNAGVPGGGGGAQLGAAFVLVAADNGAISAMKSVFAS